MVGSSVQSSVTVLPDATGPHRSSVSAVVTTMVFVARWPPPRPGWSSSSRRTENVSPGAIVRPPAGQVKTMSEPSLVTAEGVPSNPPGSGV